MNKGNEPYNLVWMESLTRKTTKEKHWKEIEICTGILNTFLSGFSSIGFFELKEDNESEYIWLLILIRCFNSIRCAIDMLLKGYYSQAMSLLRTATEDWFICGNARDDERVRECLLRDKVKMPRYLDLAKHMKAENIYKGDYSYQSKFIHSSRLSLRVLYDLEKKVARVAPTYDETLFLLCTESLMRVSLLVLEYMAHFLFFVNKDKAKYWDEQNNQYVKNVTNWLGELRVKYGGDLESINSD